MPGRWIEVVKLVFRGARFAGSAVDLEAFVDHLARHPKSLWRSANPDRERLPSRFDERVRLCLRRIEPGSAVLPLEVCFEDHEQRDLFDAEPTEVLNAVDVARRVYRAILTDVALPDQFNRTLLPEYAKWGSSLCDGESMELTPNGDEPVSITRELGSRLGALCERAYEDHVDIVGEVLEADVRLRRFQVHPHNRASVKVPFTADQEANVTQALRDHTSTRLRVRGRGEFSATGELTRVTRVDELRIEPMGDTLFDCAARPVEDVLAELAREVPPDEWRRLPPDLTDNLDQYLYGSPSR